MVEVPQVQRIQIEDQELATGRIDADRTIRSLAGLNAGVNPPSTDPNDLINFQLWMDTSNPARPELKMWDGTNSIWITIFFAAPFGGLTPPGVIMYYAGELAPSGWLFCNGQEYDSTNAIYIPLFNAIGFRYNSGGETTGNFRVPDMRDRTIFGASDTKPIGTYSGANNVTITNFNMPSHTHTLNQSGHAHGIPDPWHSHGHNNPTHAHNFPFFFPGWPHGQDLARREDRYRPTHNILANLGHLYVTHASHLGLAINAAPTNITGTHPVNANISINNNGGGGAMSVENANVACNAIIKL